jgi:hypothetical protein
LRTSIKRRIDALTVEAKAFAGRWRPNLVFLTGEPGAYIVQVNEWDGRPGSAQQGDHAKEHPFTNKNDARAFINSLPVEHRKKYGAALPELHVFDVSTPTDDEHRKLICQHRPLVLEVEAEREGLTLTQKLHQVYGDDVDLRTLPLWGDILRYNERKD